MLDSFHGSPKHGSQRPCILLALSLALYSVSALAHLSTNDGQSKIHSRNDSFHTCLR